MTLLIVEDQAWDRALLRKQLEAEGHAVLEAGDGVEALALLQRTLVDAVISDIFMPHMDGFLFCYEVRHSERLRALPFIFHTATYTAPTDRQLGQEVGADAYLTKPVSVSKLLQALKAAQRNAARRRDTRPQRTPKQGETPRTPPRLTASPSASPARRASRDPSASAARRPGRRQIAASKAP